MKTIQRLLHHILTWGFAVRRVFPEPVLHAIQAVITEGEKRHRAEVRLIIEPSLGTQAIWNGISSRDRARELFSLYRVWDTEENCGVLVYINLADRQVDIVADRGVGRVIPSSCWQTICAKMTKGFARNDFHDSTIAALTQLNTLLQEHYPDDGSRHNQLSDQPIIL